MPSYRHPAYDELPRDTRARVGIWARREDAGFTMIELLIVMVIVSILLAVAVPTFLHARKTSKQKVIVAAAASYRTAIEAFRLDHGNRVPTFGAPADWPNTGGVSVSDRGPIDQFGKPYMKSGTPEAMRTNLSHLGPLGDANAAGTDGRIVYEIGPGATATTYRITVEFLNDGTWAPICAIGNMPTTGETC